MRFAVSVFFVCALLIANAHSTESGIKIQRDKSGKVREVQLIGKFGQDPLLVTPGTIKAIAKLQDAESVVMFGTNVDDEMFQPIIGMKNLSVLDLSWTKLTGAVIKDLASMPKLRFLQLEACDVRDEHLEALESLPNLVVLRLRQTNITDKGLKHIGKLKQLVHLDLCGCEITDKGLQSIGHLPQLMHLHLTKTVRYGHDDRTDISDQSIDYLKTLKTLIDLKIGSTRISESGVNELRKALPQAKIDTSTEGVLYLGVKKPSRD